MKIWLPTVRVGSGSDVFVERLADGLREAGHDAVVEWFSPRYEFAPWLLRAVPIPPGTDVVHANSWQGFAFKRPGVPLVVTEHHYIRHPDFIPLRTAAQVAYHRLLIQRCVRRSYRAADVLVAVSENTAYAMRKDFDGPIAVIPNGIDTDLFRPNERLPVARGEKFSLLFVGNPSMRKGADMLPAISSLIGDDCEIRCLGGLRDGPPSFNRPNLRSLETVAPTCMPALYRAADAVLVLARYEAFGYVALEAMACGKPVVGFATTGTAEICIDEETALLCDVGDLSALSDRVRRLKVDKVLRKKLGVAARQRAVQYFGIKRFVESHLSIYMRLVRPAG